MVGAILTQNTAWVNVEKAIRRLRKEGALRLDVLGRVRTDTLAGWIRPSGYFNVKARRLKAFVRMVRHRYGGDLNRMAGQDTKTLRAALLGVCGIGPETADSMLLYALNRRVFVVDAYTRRFLRRHGWLDKKAGYDEVARLFEKALPRTVPDYNECHALIVKLGKHFCRARPRCEACPLRRWLPPGGPLPLRPGVAGSEESKG
jgi:endonuclease-3 related protein